MSDEQPHPEVELVARCARGERAAWESFVDRYGPLITALSRRMLFRRTGHARDADIDEISAEVFLALVRRDRILLKRYDPRYRLSTYLGVICRTEVLRHLRRGNRLPRELQEAARIQDRPGAIRRAWGSFCTARSRGSRARCRIYARSSILPPSAKAEANGTQRDRPVA